MTPRSIVALLATIFIAPSLPAQSWRTVTAARQLQDADSLKVRVDYRVGTLRLASSPQPLLYDVQLRYDEEKFDAVRSFEVGSATLTVGTRQLDERNAVISGRKQLGEMSLAFAPDVQLDIDLQTGASLSDLDFTGLSITRLVVNSGASETKFRFGTLNPAIMRELLIEVGAASVEGRQLGNTGAERVRVECGVGNVDLDFSGAWARDMTLDLDVAVGGATLRIPRDIGVQIQLDKVLASFNKPGLERRGDSYYNAAWATGSRKLTIVASTVLGSLNVEWIER
ncbi:MAG: hypothetical protein H7Z74_16585 [Anaerolineae bacterium]|nr:hypothetical protein [Gemmatimonadaceae bacterium]